MSVKFFRAKGVAHGLGLTRHPFDIVFSTNDPEIEKAWIRARREVKKRLGPGVSVAIEELTERG